MKRLRQPVKIDFTPYVCENCGNLDLMSDLISKAKPGNCRNCTEDRVRRAGPHQHAQVRIFDVAVPSFEKGEKKPKRRV